MSKYLVNKIFPAKVKKDIFYSYVQYASIRGYQFMDIAGKPFSQINVDDMFSYNIKLIFEYALYEAQLDDTDVGNNYEELQEAPLYEQCVAISDDLDIWLNSDFITENDVLYGGTFTENVIKFAPKYVEIIDILNSGEVYKGLKIN
tara:strand:- start:222 stop:659 length:438 start_codon:yes stop_codon:yes gene_type:complete